MKKLSKIVALLLAGAMAMLMFTACSGGGGSADTQKEEAIRKQLGTKSEAVKLCDNDGKVKNDSKLYKETAELLDARIKAETSAFGILLVDFDVKGVCSGESVDDGRPSSVVGAGVAAVCGSYAESTASTHAPQQSGYATCRPPDSSPAKIGASPEIGRKSLSGSVMSPGR